MVSYNPSLLSHPSHLEKEIVMKENIFIIKNGDTFKLDDGLEWVVVNPSKERQALCACVISVRNAPEGMPHFLYFLDKAVNELSRDELDCIDEEIVKVFSLYQEVLKKKVPPIMEGGRCVNAEAHLKSPYPGYFNLASWPDYWIKGPTE